MHTKTAFQAEPSLLIPRSATYRSKGRLGGALLVALDPVPDKIYGQIGDGVKQICCGEIHQL